MSEIIKLFAEDYNGWEADADPVDRARQVTALGFFCLPEKDQGFKNSKFTILENVQVGPDTIYLRVNIANPRFKQSFNYSQSMLLARNQTTGEYQIRMEVQCKCIDRCLQFFYTNIRS